MDWTDNSKEEILNGDYGIITSVEMRKEMSEMCNLSDLIEEEGIQKGIQQEREQMAMLIRKLGEASRMDDLLKATEDEEFREKLYQEFGIGK